MDGFEEHWEGWLRPVSVVALVGGVGLGWYFGLLPDGVVGWPLLLVGLITPVAVVGLRAGQLAAPLPLRAGLILVALAAGLVAASAPVALVGPSGLVVEGDLEEGERLALPAQAAGEESLIAYVHGRPDHLSGRARVHLELDAGADKPLTHEGVIEDGYNHGRRKTSAVVHHDIIWHLRADLGQGAQLSLSAPEHGVRWPLHAEVRRAPPSERTLALLGGPLLALALLLDAVGQRWDRTWLLSLALGALAFAFLFGRWFAPGTLAKTVFGAGFGALVVGGLAGSAAGWLAGRPFRRRREPAGDVPRARPRG